MIRIRTPYHYKDSGIQYVEWALVDYWIDDLRISGLEQAAGQSPDAAADYVVQGLAEGWMTRIPVGE